MPELARANRPRPCGSRAWPGGGHARRHAVRRPGRRGARGARSARAPAGPAERWTASRSASSRQRRLGRLAPGRRDEADDVGLLGQPPVGIERGDRVELAPGRADRPLEVRRFGVEHPVEVAAQGPRHLPRLELEERRRRPRSGAGTSRPPRRSSRSRRRDPAGSATTPAGRCRRAGRPAPGPRPGDTTNSRWVRPPARLSEPCARKRPRSQAVRQ